MLKIWALESWFGFICGFSSNSKWVVILRQSLLEKLVCQKRKQWSSWCICAACCMKRFIWPLTVSHRCYCINLWSVSKNPVTDLVFFSLIDIFFDELQSAITSVTKIAFLVSVLQKKPPEPLIWSSSRRKCISSNVLLWCGSRGVRAGLLAAVFCFLWVSVVWNGRLHYI